MAKVTIKVHDHDSSVRLSHSHTIRQLQPKWKAPGKPLHKRNASLGSKQLLNILVHVVTKCR